MINTRKEAREYVMQAIFQAESNKDYSIDSRDKYMDQSFITLKQKNYCNDTYSLFCNKREIIDRAIDNHSLKWKSSRIPKTDLAVLRVAVCEILFQDDIPVETSVNEAVELAKKYGTDSSHKYVNAILGSLIREGNTVE